MLGDLRYAVLSITRSRGLTAVLLLSLAVGTGTNASVSGAVHALLFGAPPGVNARGLIDIYTRMYSGAPHGPSSHADAADLLGVVPSIASLAAVDDRRTTQVRIPGYSRSSRIAAVSGAFFRTIDMRARHGRLLDDRDTADAERPAVISHRFWEELGAPADIVGATLALDDGERRIVGVAPARFLGLRHGRPIDVWIPLPRLDHVVARGHRTLGIVARLARGASLSDARRELDVASRRLADQYPGTNRGLMLDPAAPREILAVPYSPLDPDSRQHARGVGVLVLGAVALLFLSSCVNAGSLLLARVSARRRELAVKLALGATTRRVVRQLALECVLVCLAGAALGLLFAMWTADLLPAFFAPEHAEMLDTSAEPVLVAGTVAAAVLSGLLFAAVPARRDVQAPSVTLLRGDAGEIAESRGGARLRAALVCAQIAVSTLLLVSAGMLVRGLSRALESDAVTPLDRVAVVTVERRNAAYQNNLLQKLQELPDVAAAGWSSALPLGRANVRQFCLPSGGGSCDAVEFRAAVIAGDYFAALGLTLLEGRLFDGRDWARSTPVAIVDDALAREHFGARAAGRTLVNSAGRELQIVGVVASNRYRTLQPAPEPTVYFPLSQEFLSRGHLVVQTSTGVAPLLPWLATRIARIDPRLEVGRAGTLDGHLAESLALDAMITTLVGACGLLALAMAVIGVYGVMSDAVHRRTREIGLRVALGARRPQVVRLVLAETAVLAPAGLGLGLVGASAAGRIAGSFVYRLPAADAATLTVAPALLAVVVGLAAIVPLRRALAVSPTIALKAG